VIAEKSLNSKLFYEMGDFLKSSVSRCTETDRLFSEKYLTFAEFYAVDASCCTSWDEDKKRLIFK
jgi:hypothetical protein